MALWRGAAVAEPPAASSGARWIVGVVMVATFAVVLYIWGSPQAMPIVHDETAIVLQAKIFSLFRWVGDRPPIPAFFEQFHVFVEPHLAPKYPPGHAILLVPGIWLGVPTLMPLLINALSAGLLFTLARRLAGTATACLTVAFWLSSPASLQFRASYLSEPTTELLLLSAWLLALRYRDRPSMRVLVLLAVVAAWAGITRPLTAAAIMLPVGVSALVMIVRRRRWRDASVAAAAGVLVCAIIPLWSARTTGDWWTTPYARYSATYFPFDVAGLGSNEQPPTRALPPDFRAYYDYHIAFQRRHDAAHLPVIAAERLRGIFYDAWGGSWLFLVAAVVGVLVAPAEARVAALSAIALFVAYLFKAHDPAWRVYYFEAQPVLAFLPAGGVAAAARFAVSWTRRRAKREDGTHRAAYDAGQLLTWTLALLVSVRCIVQLPAARRAHEERARYGRQFRDAVAQIPEPKAVVFVHYAPGHSFHQSLIANEPDLTRARLWVVYDRGAEDAELMRVAKGRAAYIYEERDGTPEIVRTLRRIGG